MPETTPEHSQLKTLVAFDFLKVSWSQLEWAWQYTSVYASMISTEDKEEYNSAEEWYY